ncbi:hypothetical protein QW131_02925 [Roseibium salinum]|nr:hypothetical protein [Roseibium salinum]
MANIMARDSNNRRGSMTFRNTMSASLLGGRSGRVHFSRQPPLLRTRSTRRMRKT